MEDSVYETARQEYRYRRRETLLFPGNALTSQAPGHIHRRDDESSGFLADAIRRSTPEPTGQDVI